MARMKVAVLSSGGKDSILALSEARKDPELEVAALVTTLNAPLDRASMHGVRRALLVAQADALGIPLRLVPVGTPPAAGAEPAVGFTVFPPNEEYERAVGQALAALRAEGVTRVVSGDLFLEDLRAYRDRLLEAAGLAGLYPLWKRDSRELVERFMEAGFRAITVAVDARRLDRSFAGRPLDREFLDALPAGIDPAGENGEFHTFVFDGPLFRRPVELRLGETAHEGDFWFSDLVPA